MTPKQAYKEIVDYFNIEPSDHASNRLMSVLESVQAEEKMKIVTKWEKKIVYRTPETPLRKSEIDLTQIAKMVCEKYDITIRNLTGRIRKTKYVEARVYFCRFIINSCPTYIQLNLSSFLNKDHSTIVYYLYEAKVECEIPPLKEKLVMRRFA